MEFTIVEARRPRARRSTWLVLNPDGTYDPFTAICGSLREAVAFVTFKLNVAAAAGEVTIWEHNQIVRIEVAR